MYDETTVEIVSYINKRVIMVQSMTGYGKAEALCGDNKFVVEIKSVNGKGAEISLKTQLIPRDKDIEVRKMLSATLIRGNIDLFASIENTDSVAEKSINGELFLSYYNRLREIAEVVGDQSLNIGNVAEAILRIPDVLDSQKKELDQEQWQILSYAIEQAIVSIQEFRKTEGEILKKDLIIRVDLILEYLSEIEKYEDERISTVKERLLSRLEEVASLPVDNNRFEQEVIYYLEKLDITEEKVRLRQHCAYFIDTIENEDTPGKKLGFIAQEMGREINTLGSKANHAEIQRWVVRMKDELEKIKEQVLNIL